MAIAAPDIAVWVITPNGRKVAMRLKKHWPAATLWFSERLHTDNGAAQGRLFKSLSHAVQENFDQYSGHIFIMASGIVVRVIAPCLCHKTVDPAVVVVDDQGRYAVSLVSGHIGGANRLAGQVAEIIAALPVITTATDVNAKPAVDLLASESGLKIENPPAIRAVNMALLTDEKLMVHDPYGWLGRALLKYAVPRPPRPGDWQGSGVYVDDRCENLAESVLVLRPASLYVGIGCNRHTPMEEIAALLRDVLEAHRLAPASIGLIASIDLKADEPGLLALAEDLQVPLKFFSKEALNRIRHVPNPSAMAVKHAGVQSVCEAAAILAARQGMLIVPKHKTRNVTVAIARRHFTSSAAVPAA